MSALHAFLDLLVTWLTMGVCTITFPANRVDIAIDKGALDTMFYGSLLDLANEVKANVKTYLDQVVRVLKSDGQVVMRDVAAVWFIVAELLERSGVDVEVLGEQGDLLYHE
jgi:hypothetical protein